MVSSDSAITFLTVFIMVAISILFYLKSRRRWNPPLPPGPLGLPVLGCLPFLDPDLHRYFAGLALKYGPILSLRIGTKLCVVLSSPAVVQEALKDNDIIFASHDPPSVARRTLLGRSNMLWAPHGRVWRMLRKVSVQELLGPRSIEAIQPFRRRAVRRTIAKLRACAGELVEVPEMMSSTAINVMTAILWGVTLDGEDGDNSKKELRQAVEGLIRLVGEPNISDFIPALQGLDLQGLVKKMQQKLRQYEELLRRAMEKKKTAATSPATAEEEEEEDIGEKRVKTFYEVMQELVERGDPQVPLNMEHLTGLLLDLLSGGTDTTAATVEWTMAELLRHTNIIRKAQAEVDAAVGKDRAVEEFHLTKLTYLDAIVKESMRLHPVVPLLVPYLASSACIIGGYTIPPKAKVFINAWAIQRDPSVWKDPLEFKPERFLEASVAGSVGGRRYDYNGSNFSFIPFGSGRRICPGVSLGEKLVTYMLASLLHSFDWQLPPDSGEEVDMTEKFGIVLKKGEPLKVILMPRLQKL